MNLVGFEYVISQNGVLFTKAFDVLSKTINKNLDNCHLIQLCNMYSSNYESSLDLIFIDNFCPGSDELEGPF